MQIAHVYTTLAHSTNDMLVRCMLFGRISLFSCFLPLFAFDVWVLVRLPSLRIFQLGTFESATPGHCWFLRCAAIPSHSRPDAVAMAPEANNVLVAAQGHGPTRVMKTLEFAVQTLS